VFADVDEDRRQRYYVVLCCVMLCYVMLCCVVLYVTCYVNLCTEDENQNMQEC
jgi:hypothetical protein